MDIVFSPRTNNMKKNITKKDDNSQEKEPLPGYPEYTSDEDIYSKENKESMNVDFLPDEIAAKGVPSEDYGLDVPGSELDDSSEAIGKEDEENNYYSLGGDGHNDLDEDKDELWQSEK
jgi:hypothetical protein